METKVNPTPVKIVNQVYLLLQALSRGEMQKLPKVHEFARSLNKSPQAIYRWMNGDMSSPEIAQAVNDVTGSTFPAKLKGSDVDLAKHLFTICALPIGYIMSNDIK